MTRLVIALIAIAYLACLALMLAGCGDGGHQNPPCLKAAADCGPTPPAKPGPEGLPKPKQGSDRDD